MKNSLVKLIIGVVCAIIFTIIYNGVEPLSWMERGYCLVGVLGLYYCVISLFIWLFCPIKRDWMLIRGSFFWKVILFVTCVPAVLTLAIFCKYGKSFHPHELVYTSELTPCDTIDICKSKLDFSSNIEIISSTKKDTLSLRFKEMALLESICEENRDGLMANTSFWGKVLNENVLKIEPIEKEGQPYVRVIYRKGLAADFISEQKGPSLFWSVLYHFLDTGNQHMTTTDTGRGWALVISLLGVVLMNGLLVSTIISWIDRRKERWISGEVRYGYCSLLFKKYAVIIGAGETAPTIIKKLLNGEGEQKQLDYVILLTNGDMEDVRRRISSYLDDAEIKKLIIYSGQLDSIEEIYKLRIKKATEIYVLGENGAEDKVLSYHDAQNMKCVHNIASYLTDKCVERRIVCRVAFEYQTTYSVFQFSDIPDKIRQHLFFIPFNNYENWAQRVLVTGEYTETVKRILPVQQNTMDNGIQACSSKKEDEERRIEYLPLEGRNGIQTDSEQYVHLVIIGMSKMGVAMAIQAAQVAHYPNFKVKDGHEAAEPKRTRITFIDSNADNEMNFFKGRYQNLFALSRSRYIDATSGACPLSDIEWEDPMLDDTNPYSYLGPNFVDIEWEFVKGSVEQPSVRNYLEQISSKGTHLQKEHSILTIAVCLPLVHEAVAASLYLPAAVYDYAQQILVYQREASDIVYNLYYFEKENEDKRYVKLRPFGMKYADFTTEKINYYRAQLCNYVYDLMFDGSIGKETINHKIADIKDASDSEAMKPAREKWNDLSIFNRWSNRYLANSFETKVRSVGGSVADFLVQYDEICRRFEVQAEMLAECEHNRWNVQQLLMGFRAYNQEEKEHYDHTADKKNFKKWMKRGREKAHLNICSFASLDQVDKEAKEYDRIFNKAVPEILKLTETAKKKQETEK